MQFSYEGMKYKVSNYKFIWSVIGISLHFVSHLISSIQVHILGINYLNIWEDTFVIIYPWIFPNYRLLFLKYRMLTYNYSQKLFEEIEESLHKRNPRMWIKTLGGGLLGTISGCLFLTVLCLVLRCTRETIWELRKKEVARLTYLLLQKQEGGAVVGIPNNVLSQLWEIPQKQNLGKQHIVRNWGIIS